jgi:hypothetical protein
MPPGKRTGRPPLFDVPTSTRVTLAVTPQQYAALQQVARDERVSKSTIIRRAVNRFVDDYGERRPFVRK